MKVHNKVDKPTPNSSQDEESTISEESTQKPRAHIGWLVITTAITVTVTAVMTGVIGLVKSDLTREPPVTVTALSNPGRISAYEPPFHFVVPNSANTTSDPGQGCAGLYEWVHGLGGVDAGLTRLQILIRGNSEKPVVVTAMRVLVQERTDPMSGIAIACPSAGELNQRSMTIDLDQADPTVRYLSADGRAFGFTVGQDEVESLLVSAGTEKSLVRWRLALELDIDGKLEQVEVDSGEKDFATTPVMSKSWEYWGDQWVGGDATIPVGQPLPRRVQ
jgi:hypothetical protein